MARKSLHRRSRWFLVWLLTDQHLSYPSQGEECREENLWSLRGPLLSHTSLPDQRCFICDSDVPAVTLVFYAMVAMLSRIITLALPYDSLCLWRDAHGSDNDHSRLKFSTAPKNRKLEVWYVIVSRQWKQKHNLPALNHSSAPGLPLPLLPVLILLLSQRVRA